VVVHAHPRAQRVLQRIAAAAARGVEVVDDLAAGVGLGPEVAIVDLATTELDLPARHPGIAWIAVPGDGTAPGPPDRAAALLDAGWRHVITQPVPLLGDDLLAALVGLGGGPAGLDGVLLGGVALGRLRLDDAGDREAAAAALVEDLIGMGLSDRVASLARVVADELLTNALHAAPAGGGAGQIELSWGSDARYLGIEVRDPWGSLDLAALGPRLATRVRGGGAAPDDGLGFGLVHACCQRLSVVVEAGRQTRAVALLDLRHRATALARAGSVHLVG
jgi:anti-sigma regulatory factor (Ser/Thr protein kinase)